MKIGDNAYFVRDTREHKIAKVKINGIQQTEQGITAYCHYRFAHASEQWNNAEKYFSTQLDAEKAILADNPLPKMEMLDWTKEGVIA